jgi:hypothetical protein
MDIDALQIFVVRHAQKGIEMFLRGMNEAVGEQSHQMQRAVVEDGAVHRVIEHGVG